MNQFNKLMYVGTTLLALGACDIDESSDIGSEAARLQFGGILVEVSDLPAESVSTVTSAKQSPAKVEKSLDFKEFQEMLSAVGGSLSFSNSIVPEEGPLEELRSFTFLDTCGRDTPPLDITSEAGVPNIANVDSVAKTFDYVLTFPSFEDRVESCWYSGPFYGCSIDDQVLDFTLFGFELDATVTVKQSRGGLLINSTAASLLESYTNNTTCEGADCGVPPASNLFGIVDQVPCHVATVTAYK